MSTEHIEWHADEQELAAYASGQTSRALAASLETHLLACSRCRGTIGRLAGVAERDQAWERLADTIDRPSESPLGRLARGHRFQRSTVATPAMVQAATVAIVLVGLVPLAAAMTAGDSGLVALLLLAPLAPMAAVALAYREWADPAGEISLATASAGLKLVALRALVVSLAGLPLAFLAMLAVDSLGSDVPMQLAAAWFLPGLALAALVLLAGTTRLDPLQVAVGLSLAWVVSVGAVVAVRRSLRPELFLDLIAGPAVQGAALAVVLAAALLTVARRDAVTYRRNV